MEQNEDQKGNGQSGLLVKVIMFIGIAVAAFFITTEIIKGFGSAFD